MELEELVGKHYLSGFDTTINEINNSKDDDVGVVRFVLDDKTYKAVEDSNDGYRSYLSDLVITDEKISNIFPPQEVVCKMEKDTRDSINYILKFIDKVTNKTVLKIGTANVNDYYPYCVADWYPENLAINIDR